MTHYLKISLQLGCFIVFIMSCQIKQDKAGITTTTVESKVASAIQNAKDSLLDIKIVTGKFDPAHHPSYVKIDTQYANRAGLFLHKETYESFKKMYAAAKEEDIKLIIKSATRNFDYQKGIWERKWTGVTKINDNTINAATDFPKYNRRAQKILEYSSMPGTSRHHWGTDIDLNFFENYYFESGEGLLIYEWLSRHASEYGFCQVYTPKGSNRPNGYNEEKWHWSYLPVANQLMAIAKQSLNSDMISGFKGSEVAKELDVVNKYVFGINPACIE